MRPIALEFPKWQEWTQRIMHDVQNRLVNPRQVYRDFAEIVNANVEHIGHHEGGVFCKFVQRCYGSHAAMAIRSQIKKKDDSVSLMLLLSEIRDSAHNFTFEFYLQQFPIDSSYVDWQSETFSLFSEDGAVVSAQTVQKDIDDLKRVTAQVETLVDRSLAHLDKRGFDGDVTFGDLDACIDAFDQLVCKYLRLIDGRSFITLEPTILLDWKKILRVPLDIRAIDAAREQPFD